MHLSIRELQEITGRDWRTVKKRIEGLNSVGKKRNALLFESKDAIEKVLLPDLEEKIKLKLKNLDGVAKAAYSSDFDDHRIKKAKADKLELELAEKRKELVRIDEVVEEVENKLSVVRTSFLALPSNCATALSIIVEPSEIEAELSEQVNMILAELSREDDK